MKKTYLLGAGFSKAFHQSMPLMNELAGEVLLELGLDAEVLSPFRDDLEAESVKSSETVRRSGAL